MVADRRTVLRGAAYASALGIGAGLANTLDAVEAATTGVNSFALAVLPDTQFYSRYAAPEGGRQFQSHYGSTPFAAQTGWIAQNAARYNIPFVIHLGDVVDQFWVPDQWQVADAAVALLEKAGVPYSILAGNHDVHDDWDYNSPSDQSVGTDAQRLPWQEPFLAWFPSSRAAKQATFRGRDGSGFHEYHVFTAAGINFLVLSLSWRISDAAIAWARSVIASNPTLPVILASHQVIAIDSDGISPLETAYGQMLWDRLIVDNDQIFMTLNGHHHGAAHLPKMNKFGNLVHEMVVDYQMDYQGGNAMTRLYELDFTNNKINAISISPWVVEKPAKTLNQFDFAELAQPNERFSIPFNFHKRFAGFMRFRPTPAFAAPILPRIRSDLLTGFTEPVAPVLAAPAGVDDFPLVPDAYAHWRVPTTLTDGQVVAFGEVLPDVLAGNHMTRVSPDAGLIFGDTEPGDILWTTDKHYLSSAAGSILFTGTDKTQGRLSAFTTAVGIDLNGRDFLAGYTVETFVKLPLDWNAAQHSWGNMLGREGNRGNLSNYWGGDPGESSVLFAISNLREVQWEVVAATSTNYAEATWSGEIIRGTWFHIAVVNDPATATTTMYVDGAPVLRNFTNAATGLAAQGSTQFPWIIGAGWTGGDGWGGLTDGFYGALGEVRITPRPLPQSLWLTARRT